MSNQDFVEMETSSTDCSEVTKISESVVSQKVNVSCVKYSINTYVQYLNYDLLIIAKMPIYELTGNHTLNLPPLYL